MFHGLWVILGNATLRQFGIGVVIAVTLVAGFAVYQRVTADPGTHPSEWLTAAEEAELAGAIQSLGGAGDWVAGCLWDGDSKDITGRVDVPGGSRDRYIGTASSGREMAFVVVAGVRTGGTLQRHEERGSFCLVPVGP